MDQFWIRSVKGTGFPGHFEAEAEKEWNAAAAKSGSRYVDVRRLAMESSSGTWESPWMNMRGWKAEAEFTNVVSLG